MASLSTHGGPADSSRPLNARISGIDGNRTTFDGVTIAFHWVTVILVLGLLTTAIWSLQSHDDVLKVLLLRIHRSLGVTVWTVTVLRLVRSEEHTSELQSR